MERISSNFNGLFLGLVAGGAIGAAAGFLFAPKSGEELISGIKEKGSRFYEDAQQMISAVEEKTISIFEDGRRKTEELKKEVDRRLSEVHLKACKALSCEAETRAEA